MPSNSDQNRRDVARHRQKVKDAGFIRIEVYVPREDAPDLRAIAAQMRARKASKGPSKP